MCRFSKHRKKAPTFYSQSLNLPLQCLSLDSVLSYCLIKPRHFGECFCLEWITYSLGSLSRSPTRTRPTNSPPDCSLLRNGLFESRPLQSKNKKSPPYGEDFYFWSGLRDSNSLPSPWQGDALPDELNPRLQDIL